MKKSVSSDKMLAFLKKAGAQKVKYITTGPFALLPEGSVVNAFVVTRETDRALLFFPRDAYGSGCYEIAVTNDGGQTWRSGQGERWINIAD